MPFPSHIQQVLDRFGVKPETKAALYDLYTSLGEAVFDIFIELADARGDAARVEPEDLSEMRQRVAENYLRTHHANWMAGRMTPSFWFPRVLEGRAAGMIRPLGFLDECPDTPLTRSLAAVVREAVGQSQPVPEGVVLFGKNAHYGGRLETISFDVVPVELEEALAVSRAKGQQHTSPGSVGETSGTISMLEHCALVWEVQPNVLKPTGERNGEINRIWRRHRNWHVTTLAASLLWLTEQKVDIFILRGAALAPTHEVNPAKPVSDAIEQFHDRTVETVAAAMAATLEPVTAADVERIERAELMNHALGKWVAEEGGAGAFRRFHPGAEV